THAGRPDMVLTPERGGVIFVEAKRFGIIKELAQARKIIDWVVTPGLMSLPGMATDRTREEQQAINYAFKNGGTWAILTNFEKLRLFNARRDWLVLSFERPSAYLDEFDLLWQLSYASVCGGGLDRLSNQRHREDVDTDYLAFINEWRERLAQDIIARRDDNPWAFALDGRVNLTALRSVVQRVLDRLVVVRFAEDHLIAPAGTLFGLYELHQNNPYTFTLSEFFRQLYRRFDQDHNSALFALNLADQAIFSDEVLGGLVQKLYEARYRAMSADIMGNTYEQYLGKTLAQSNGNVVTVDNLETRKKQGSYYTPQVIVRYIVDNALGRYLYATADGKPDGAPASDEKPKTAADILGLRVLDPACGSGSFLIYAYQVLADFYRREIGRLEKEREQREQELVRQGMTMPFDLRIELAQWTAEIERLQDYPRLILETHLYGIDLDPQAAEIATVNLIMQAMADQRRNDKRLPLILNQNIKVGNSLIGAGPADPRYADHTTDLAELGRLRLKLVAEANGPEHQDTLKVIDEIAGRVSAALNQDLTAYLPDVAAHRPLNWAVEFPEAFVDEAGQALGEAAGFEVVVGNPPWEIVKPDLREFYAQFDPRIESKLTRRQVERRIAELSAADPRREADWLAQKARIEEVAAYYRASSDYTRQGRGDTATHKLFLERAYSLLEREGRLGFVIPSGIYTDLGTKPLREMFFKTGHVEYLYGLSNVRGFFPEVDSRFKFTLLGAIKGGQTDRFRALFLLSHAEWPLLTQNRNAQDIMADVITDDSRVFDMSIKLIERFSPDSLSVMEFQTQQAYGVTETIFDNHPLLGENIEGVWNVKFTREFDKTNDRALFNTHGHGLPVYEGKNLGFYGEILTPPTIWIDETEGRGKLLSPLKRRAPDLDDAQIPLDYEHYRFGFRRIARSTDFRTLYVSYLPRRVFAMYTLTTTVQHHFDGESFRPYMTKSEEMFLYACMASFVLDFVMRFQVSTSVAMFNAYSLPVPRLTAGNPYFDALVPRAARLTCTTPEFAALWQEVMGEGWDESKGATDPAERQTLRDELDALVAHLYTLSRDDLVHILGTFPLVFPDDDAGQVKKEALLAVYDRFAQETVGWGRV
ncbi:MAG: N-6 DNA methylase, partial [Chloroflexi bacterium]|nr:N-6 DNA methylase [Chloroflexota bacterium]